MKNVKPNKWFSYLFLFIPIIFFFLMKYVENDNWFLFAHGREILTNGFPHIEFLTIHDNLHFVMPQWLSSVIFYELYHYLGFLGLYIFLFIIFLVFMYLTLKLCLIISNNKLYISCIITALVTCFFELTYITPRPQVFTYLILLGVLIIMELFIQNKKDYLYLLPVLSLIQINFHASMWPVFFIFIMPFIAELLLKKDKRIIKLLIVVLISILIGFINPYGIENMLYGINSYGVDVINNHINEMRSINFNGSFNNSFYSYFILSLFFIINIILIYRNKNKTKIHEILLIYGTFFMAIMNIRNFGLFYIGALPFISKYFNIKDGNSTYFPKILYIVLSIILGIVIVYSFYNKKYIIDNPNEEAVKYLNKNESKNIKIYTSYKDGAYYEYYGYKVYLDPRAEVFIKKNNKKEDILEEYVELKENDYKDFEEFNKKYDFDYYVVDNSEKKLVKKLKENNFIKVFESKKRDLYKKNMED